MLYASSASAIFLSPAVSSMFLEVTSPFLLTIDPQNSLAFAGTQAYKAYKIEYLFNDGTPPIVKEAYVDLFKKDYTLPIFNDPGDPRNYPVNHLYSSKNGEELNIFTKVKVYWYTAPQSVDFNIVYNINIRLIPHSLKHNGFFDKIHLGQTRMFGFNNDILYNFEGVNPTYSMPVLVNWKHKPPTNLLPEVPT